MIIVRHKTRQTISKFVFFLSCSVPTHIYIPINCLVVDLFLYPHSIFLRYTKLIFYQLNSLISFIQDDWDSDFDDDHSPGPGHGNGAAPSAGQGGVAGGHTLSLPAGHNHHQTRGSTGDVSSVGQRHLLLITVIIRSVSHYRQEIQCSNK